MSAAQEDSGPRRGLLPRFTLKDGDTFLLADALGDIQDREDGLFTNDTRILSKFALSVAGRPVSLLGAAVSQDNTTFIAHLTNRPLPALGEQAIPQGVIHIERRRILSGARLYEQLTLTNFSDRQAELTVRFAFAADYADLFEVQGHVRPARGQILKADIVDRGVRLAYRGLDGLVRNTAIEFSRQPLSLGPDSAEFLVTLERTGVDVLYVEIGSPSDAQAPLQERYRQACNVRTLKATERLQAGGSLQTSARLFNQWIDKSRADLALLTTPLPTGPYPYAGIPWFSTQFGRDAVITALQTLWLDPQLAAGVLRFLASTQATETSKFRDSEPGKIMHEMRRGEMANLREVPFGRYYGGVDTTPLFVMLAGAYEERVGDRSLVNEIWPNLLAATSWIEARLDRSATGFLDYARGEESGLANQGWKDSQDSIFHADGRMPKGPIAVVEVQGYAYAALTAMARLASIRRDQKQSDKWLARATALREAIEERFWIPSLSFYAIALDGAGEQCRVRASNAGHLLFCGVPTLQHADEVCSQLLSDGFCGGWGIRTLLEGEARRVPARCHPRTGALPCRMPAASVGERVTLHVTAGNSGHPDRWSRQGSAHPTPRVAARYRDATHLRAARGRCVHRHRVSSTGDEVGTVPSGHTEGGVKVLAHL